MCENAYHLSGHGKGCRDHGIEVRSVKYITQTGQHHLPQSHTPLLFGMMIEAVNHGFAPRSIDA